MPATQADYDRLGGWAVYLDKDQNIDKHGRKRTVPMEVLSLGFSRTGTLSMREALTILGYPTYHYCNLFANCKDADIWQEALDVKVEGKGSFDWNKGFDQVLGDCSAVTDNPCVAFWKELIQAYPNAKVLLVERDEERWAKSIGVVFEGVLHPAATYFLRFADPFWFGKIVTVGRGWIKAFVGTTDKAEANRRAIPAYRKHNTDVKAAVPKERLLVYQLGSGWEPLCKFLGKDVPNVPFPKKNEAAVLETVFEEVIGQSFKNSLFNIALVIGAGVAVVAALRYTF